MTLVFVHCSNPCQQRHYRGTSPALHTSCFRGMRLPLGDGRASHQLCFWKGWGGRNNTRFLPWMKKNLYKGQNNWRELSQGCEDTCWLSYNTTSAPYSSNEHFWSLLPHSWAPSLGIHHEVVFSLLKPLPSFPLSRVGQFPSELRWKNVLSQGLLYKNTPIPHLDYSIPYQIRRTSQNIDFTAGQLISYAWMEHWLLTTNKHRQNCSMNTTWGYLLTFTHFTFTQTPVSPVTYLTLPGKHWGGLFWEK